MRLILFLLLVVGSSHLGWCQMLDASVDNASMKQQPNWQMSIDDIKKDAERLVIANNTLIKEDQLLDASIEKFKKAIFDTAQRNLALDNYLAPRADKSDQDLELESIEVNIKERDAHKKELMQAISKTQKDIETWQRKIKIKKLKMSDWELRKKAKEEEVALKKRMYQATVPTAEELMQLRKDLEKQKAAEAQLEEELKSAKENKQAKVYDVDALRREVDSLRQKSQLLEKELTYRQNNQLNAINAQMPFKDMKDRKRELETKIKAYEQQIEALKNPYNMMTSWDKDKKDLVHQMVQSDSRNQQLRSKITNLQEDIQVLRDQVARLERRVNFGQGKGYDKKSNE